MEEPQAHTVLLLILLFCSLIFIYIGREKKRKVNVKYEKKVVRKEAADDEDVDDEDDEDYEKPALGEHLEHIPFQHEILPESEMIARSAEFYSAMNKRRTLRQGSAKEAGLSKANLIV